MTPVGFTVALFFALVAIGAVLITFGLVPDPYTYWSWVCAVLLLLSVAFAAVGGRRWL